MNWFRHHPNWTVALWCWGLLVFYAIITGWILYHLPEESDLFGIFGILGIIRLCGILYLCYWNLKIKKRSLANLWWLLLQGLGVIMILCLTHRNKVRDTLSKYDTPIEPYQKLLPSPPSQRLAHPDPQLVQSSVWPSKAPLSYSSKPCKQLSLVKSRVLHLDIPA